MNEGIMNSSAENNGIGRITPKYTKVAYLSLIFYLLCFSHHSSLIAETPKMKVILLLLSILVISIERIGSFHCIPIYPVTYNRRQSRKLLSNENDSKKPMVPDRQKTMKLIKDIISKLDSALGNKVNILLSKNSELSFFF